MTRTTIALAGELDYARRAELEEVVQRGADAEGDVVLDLHAVSFLDSSGLGAIAKLSEKLAERGSTLHLAGATRRVLSVLELAGLDRAVSVEGLPGDDVSRRCP